MTKPLSLRDTMRAQSVSRWQIVPTTRTQSIAEHSWAVGMIAGRLWAEQAAYEGRECHISDVARLSHAALWHDVPEVFTGDIATPTKVWLKENGLGDKLKKLENSAGPDYVQAMALSDSMRHCLKLADFIEAIWYLNEFMEGTYASKQYVNLVARFDTYITLECPEWRTVAFDVSTRIRDRGTETEPFERVGDVLYDKG